MHVDWIVLQGGGSGKGGRGGSVWGVGGRWVGLRWDAEVNEVELWLQRVETVQRRAQRGNLSLILIITEALMNPLD